MTKTRKKHMYKYKGGKKKVKAKAKAKPKAKTAKKTMKKDFKDKKAKYDKKADELQTKMEEKAGKMGKEALEMAKKQKKKLSAGLDKIQGTLSGKNQKRMQAARNKLKGAMAMMMPIIKRVGKTSKPWIKAYMHMIKRMMTMYAAAVGTIANKAGMGKYMPGMKNMMGKMGNMMKDMPGMSMMKDMPGMGMMKDMPGMNMMKKTKEKSRMEKLCEYPTLEDCKMNNSIDDLVQIQFRGGKYRPYRTSNPMADSKTQKPIYKKILGYIKKRFKPSAFTKSNDKTIMENYLNPDFKVPWEGKKKNTPLTGPEYVDRAKIYLDPRGNVFDGTKAAKKAMKGGRKTRKYRKYLNRRTRKTYY